MMDIAVQHSMQKQAARTAADQVSPQDEATFAAMTANPAQTASTATAQASTMQTTAATQAASPASSAINAVSAGEKILQSLEKLGAEINVSKTQIIEQAGTSTAGRMCQLQFEVAQFSTKQAILGQSGSKSSQGVQTLLKGQ